ncbi:MAG: hypothetical protein AB7I35_17160 [Ramlibacter sp.]|nr:hypothetical protein [Ramlibacter sp.]
MTVNRKLPGLELMGLNYDVTEYYADARSIDPLKPLFNLGLSTYNPATDPAPGTITIDGTTYGFPSNVTVIPLNNSQMIEQTTQSVTDFQLHLNVNAQAGGWYEGFSGSVEASFDATYRTSTSFYSLTHMGLIQSYSVTLPELSELRDSYLTPEAASDINGSMSPASLVAKYGAFFLKAGIFGGALNYSQSISRYSVETQTAAAAKVSANYLAFVNGSMSTSVQTDNVATTEQSNGHFEAKGGSPDQLQQGYQPWAAALMREGDFALVNFNQHSLTPLWLLAQDPARQNAIEACVRDMLSSTPPQMNTLQWDTQNKTSFYAKGSSKDNIEKQVVLTDPAQVIVGVACSAHSDNVSRLALRVLNLNDNSLTWITDDNSVYNQSNYQQVADIPAATQQRGVAVTGMGFTCTKNVVSAIWLHYQMLNPADSSGKPTFLGSVVNTYYCGDNAHQKAKPEANFTPDAGAGKPITGVGLRIKSDNFATMKLWQAPLLSKAESATTVVAAVEHAQVKEPLTV